MYKCYSPNQLTATTPCGRELDALVGSTVTTARRQWIIHTTRLLQLWRRWGDISCDWCCHPPHLDADSLMASVFARLAKVMDLCTVRPWVDLMNGRSEGHAYMTTRGWGRWTHDAISYKVSLAGPPTIDKREARYELYRLERADQKYRRTTTSTSPRIGVLQVVSHCHGECFHPWIQKMIVTAKRVRKGWPKFDLGSTLVSLKDG